MEKLYELVDEVLEKFGEDEIILMIELKRQLGDDRFLRHLAGMLKNCRNNDIMELISGTLNSNA